MRAVDRRGKCVNAFGQSLRSDGDRSGESTGVVNHDIEIDRAALMNGGAAGAGVLMVDRGDEEIGCGLSNRENVLVARPAAAIAVLHEHAVLLLRGEVRAAGHVADVAVEGVDPGSEVVQFRHAIILLVQHHEIRIGPSGNSLAIHLESVAAGLGWFDLEPIGIALFVEAAREDNGKRQHLRLAWVVVRLDFE